MNHSMNIAIWGARALLVALTLFTAAGATASPRPGHDTLRAAAADDRPIWSSIISIIAPDDARRVTVFLSFGTVKQLHYDSARNLWRGRFPVPEGISDGHYEVLVTVEHADGRLEQRRESYNLDGSATDFGMHVPHKRVAPGEALVVELDGVEPASAAYLSAESLGQQRLALTHGGDAVDWRAKVRVPSNATLGKHRVRVEVCDRLGNTYTRWFTLDVRTGGEA